MGEVLPKDVKCKIVAFVKMQRWFPFVDISCHHSYAVSADCSLEDDGAPAVFMDYQSLVRDSQQSYIVSVLPVCQAHALELLECLVVLEQVNCSVVFIEAVGQSSKVGKKPLL